MEKIIKREVFNKITPWLGRDKILILKGARQVGKTTLMKQLKEYVKEKFPESKSVYLTADNLENQDIFASPASLMTYISLETGFPDNFVFLFIDEFQYIEQAGQFLKNIFDENKGKEKLQIIVSGSSSLEITKNQEFLTGRALDFMIDRVNFREFVNWKKDVEMKPISIENFSEMEKFYSAYKGQLSNFFEEYILFGGYPEVLNMQTEEEKKIILSSIVKNYIEKDIIGFLRVENASAFNKLLMVLSSQIGSLVNVSQLSDMLGISIQTVNKYLDILEGTFVFRRVTPYFRNTGKEVVKMPKIFVLDMGIKNYFSRLLNSGKIVSGEEAENFIYLELCSQLGLDYNLIHFYRTKSGTEIDFVVETSDTKVNLIESKYRNNPRAGALENFRLKYPDNAKYSIVITKDYLAKKGENIYIPMALFPFVELKK